MLELIGKIVEVETDQMLYIGKLIEVREDEVHLQGETGWIIIPMERIALIREKAG